MSQQMGNSRISSQTIGTASALVSRVQPLAQRVLFIIQNVSTGSQVINLAFGQNAVAGQGPQLSPGGYYVEALDNGFKPTNEDINAISSASGGSIAVTERVIFDGR